MTVQRRTEPTVSLKQPGFQYVPSYATDIRATFARFQTEKPSCAMSSKHS